MEWSGVERSEEKRSGGVRLSIGADIAHWITSFK